MPLEAPDAQHLNAAHGYLALDMYEEANEELEAITAELHHAPQVLMVQLAIYRGTERWRAMASLAAKLVQRSGGEPDLFVDLPTPLAVPNHWTTPTRSWQPLRRDIPDTGLILFNLACYEAQLGRLDEARLLLQRAFKIDNRFKAMSLDDPDLPPLWSDGGS